MVSECKAGSVFLLDYDEWGLEAPEMTKRRIVAVVSPKALNSERLLATVIPLSTSPPNGGEKHVVPLSKEYYWLEPDVQVWAKCDMIYTPALARLDHLNAFKKARRGNNYQPVPQLNAADLRNIRIGLAHAVGLDELIIKDARSQFRGYMAERFRRLLPRYAARTQRTH
jgi:uncharacterized protein YifN (PemK superfamily)